jgi:hypothetical protein
MASTFSSVFSSGDAQGAEPVPTPPPYDPNPDNPDTPNDGPPPDSGQVDSGFDSGMGSGGDHFDAM